MSREFGVEFVQIFYFHQPKKSTFLSFQRKGEYCFDYDSFPCEKLQRLDKRYKTKYKMSEIENLKTIKEKGIKAFLAQEKKWLNSGGTIVFMIKNATKNSYFLKLVL